MIWTAFILGLAGSLHCAGMCGPLALALPAGTRSRSTFVAGRIAYNAGRVTTYALLGVFFGLLGRSLVLVGVQRWLSIGAGVALLGGLFFASRLGLTTPAFAAIGWLKRGLGRLITHRNPSALFLFGMLNGLLPCGLVYAAGAGAAAAGSIAAGIGYMAVFGMGTVPLMLGLTLSQRVLPIAWRTRLSGLVPASLVLVAGLLILRGLGLGIPYLSPAFDPSGKVAPCHQAAHTSAHLAGE